MDDSGLTATRDDRVPPTNHFVMVTRALISAAIFGTLGVMLGKWIGQRGNHEHNKMAEPIIKWSMGAFWATLATHSSMKASQREEKREEVKSVVVAAAQEGAKIELHTPVKTPASLVDTGSAKAVGMVQEIVPEPVLQK